MVKRSARRVLKWSAARRRTNADQSGDALLSRKLEALPPVRVSLLLRQRPSLVRVISPDECGRFDRQALESSDHPELHYAGFPRCSPRFATPMVPQETGTAAIPDESGSESTRELATVRYAISPVPEVLPGRAGVQDGTGPEYVLKQGRQISSTAGRRACVLVLAAWASLSGLL